MFGVLGSGAAGPLVRVVIFFGAIRQVLRYRSFALVSILRTEDDIDGAGEGWSGSGGSGSIFGTSHKEAHLSWSERRVAGAAQVEGAKSSTREMGRPGVEPELYGAELRSVVCMLQQSGRSPSVLIVYHGGFRAVKRHLSAWGDEPSGNRARVGPRLFRAESADKTTSPPHAGGYQCRTSWL